MAFLAMKWVLAKPCKLLPCFRILPHFSGPSEIRIWILDFWPRSTFQIRLSGEALFFSCISNNFFLKSNLKMLEVVYFDRRNLRCAKEYLEIERRVDHFQVKNLQFDCEFWHGSLRRRRINP
jgi:hypothetical protein